MALALVRTGAFFEYMGLGTWRDPVFSVFERVVARLRKEFPEIKVITKESLGNVSQSGDVDIEKRTLIGCSAHVAEEMMLEMQTWCEFAAERAGAKVQPDAFASEGRLVTFLATATSLGLQGHRQRYNEPAGNFG